ncbi:MAG: metalloregulator ArsR/SmtB family transcription factor [Eubacterium sp.]|nr:metalloregulator ArsR/SmtB family transcription factor [Eubacterium sp.]
MHTKKEYAKLAKDFKECQKVLVALGDENRLHILYQMMVIERPRGVRVGEIVKMSNLSRPAVSHHMKILKKAGIVRVRPEGTMNFYYLDPDMKSFKDLISVLQRSTEYAAELPYRVEE